MSGKVVNLRQIRKQKARAEKQDKAAENRSRYGRTKTEKAHDAARDDQDQRRHDGHFLGDKTPDE